MYKKIISLAPSITETVCLLGCRDLLIGRTEYCDRPENVSDIPAIGGFVTTTKQKIIEMKPDLVIGTTLHIELLKEVERSGVETGMIPSYSIDQASEMIWVVAEILNQLRTAGTLIRKVENEIAEIRFSARRSISKRVCYLCDISCPIWKTCIVPQAIAFLNCKLVGREYDHTSGKKKQIEAILDDAPELVIVPDNHREDAAPLIADDSELGNYIRERGIPVKSFPSNLLERTGPSSGYALKLLFKTIYGESKQL